MPEELRTAFHQQLEQIEATMTRLFAMVAEGLAAATDAILSGDRDVVRMLVERESTIDGLYVEVESLVNSALTLQAPVAGDLRFLLSSLRIVPELERSHDLVEHIARRGAQGISGELSPRTRGLIEQMGTLGTDMWQRAGTAFLARDPHESVALAELDDQMDELHSLLTAELASGKMSLPVAMDMTLVARFYERLGDHAVNTARRVVYLAGGSANQTVT